MYMRLARFNSGSHTDTLDIGIFQLGENSANVACILNGTPSEIVSTRTLIAVCISDFDSLARPVRNPALKYQVPRFRHVRRGDSANLRYFCILYACSGEDNELNYRSGQSPHSARK